MIRIHNFARGVRGQRVVWQCEEMSLPYQVETVGFPQEERVERALRHAADMLGDDPFPARTHFTLADISVTCARGMWRGPLGHALPDKLVACRERLAARPAYQRAFKPQ